MIYRVRLNDIRQDLAIPLRPQDPSKNDVRKNDKGSLLIE
jgi:hypothetical protein